MALYLLSLILLHIISLYPKTVAQPPSVVTEYGTLKGRFWLTRDNRSIEAYLGIRYGKAPVGALRFEAPQPAEPWKGDMVVDTMPPSCLQPSDDEAQTEDCLFLNVFTPHAQEQVLLPVLFYIFGGRHIRGSISTITPEFYLDEDIVLVTPQFRIGLFGYLSTNDKVVPGNMGLKDTRLALRWVRDHIRHFGGDPERVTIVGHSSGGTAVHALMMYAADEGLFRAGISQSGSVLKAINFQPPELTKSIKKVISDLSGCPHNSYELVQCLKAKPADDIIQLWTRYQDTTVTGVVFNDYFPLPGLVIEPECAEDRIITDNPWNRSVNLPWITGVNALEGLNVVSPLIADRSDVLFSLLNTYFEVVFPQIANYQYSSVDGSGVPVAIRDFYLQNQTISRETRHQLAVAFGDFIFVYPIFYGMNQGNASMTYVYVNEYIVAKNISIVDLPPEDLIGPDHTTDVFFFFPHAGKTSNYSIISKDDERISKKMVKLWVNFAKTLQPTTDGEEVQWNPFGSNQSYLNITAERFFMNEPFLPDRMSFWQRQPFTIRDDDLDVPSCTSSEITSLPSSY